MAQHYVFTDFKLPNHIRLLTIHSRDYVAALQGSISEHPLAEAPAYEALSYAWGSPEGEDEARPSMTLDGQRFDISCALERALRRLRKLDNARIMWIDSVCINQANKEERNAQVAIMPDIYRGAARVVAWIGEKTRDSDRALLFLKEMAMHQKFYLRHNWIDGERLGSDTFRIHEEMEGMKKLSSRDAWNKVLDNSKHHGHIITGIPILYASPYHPFFEDARQADWEAVDNLLARPWWSRTWVVQEIWQAQEAILQCGDSTLKWKTVRKAMQYQEAWDDMGCLVRGTKRWELWATLKRRYGLAIHISQHRLLGSKLSDLLWNVWDRDATDPRDKIFAILGLVGKDYGDTMPAIDYCKSVEQVYKEIASFIMTEEKSLDLLLAASGLHSQSTLPSWVPDWRRAANDNRPALFINASLMRIQCYFVGSAEALYLNGHGFSASGQLEARMSFGDDLSVLCVHGLLFDTVTEVSEGFGNDLSADTIIQGAQSTITKAYKSGTSLLKTLVNENELRRILAAGSLIDPHSLRTESQAIENVMRLRRCFVTSGGHFCIGPSKTQTGDVISIFAGCNFPIVLRPIGSFFTVVGEAYVPNYMAGEILIDNPPGTSGWIDISLREWYRNLS
ncbi:HET-domain-containing protein [Trichoderma citrinoviride]|uniref:HET-domain-containing protein n=1 Tax=Trichoderma citrinoviride TaxID=58853 RepID=A0A2T4B1P7_9HYPO|nr:HET-domain-containing protein [Trichoderma citrinoviride]PTB63234.1 HET-domain-containing protein [Trichoderma citrinoviride]